MRVGSAKLGPIVIRGAREHNLKGIDLDIPRHRLVVITGVSGSGKSSLAFDTLYRERQRRYLETLSPYARQHYRVTVYRDSGHCRCSCPSRQRPCKHGLALMLILVELPEALGIASPPRVESVPLDEALSRAQKAQDARDLPSMLGALLDGWRGVPAVELAELIDLLDAAIAGERLSPLLQLKRTALQQQWIETAQGGDPADLGALLATIGGEPCLHRAAAAEKWQCSPHRAGHRTVRMRVGRMRQ